MQIFKYSKFARFAKKHHLDDATLCQVVEEMEDGIIHADLGGGVFKQRVARKGQGKRGGYRVIVLYKIGTLALFVHGFSKSDEDNISPAQEEKFKELSRLYLGLSEQWLKKLVASKEFTEVQYDEKET
nr:type II toxin-antitoxin system RelE/ParE family toxin [Nitrosomonas nitrosa]